MPSSFIRTIEEDHKNREALRELKKAVQQQELIVWIGGELSEPGFRLSLSKLIADLSEGITNADKKVQIQKDLKEGFLDEAMDLLRLSRPKKFDTELRKWKASVSAQDKEVLQCLPFLKARAYFTFNYDQTLEQLFPGLSTPSQSLIDDASFFENIADHLEQNVPFILHIKGILEPIDSTILRQADYKKLYTDSFKKFLKKLICQYAILFIGCDLKNDPIMDVYAELVNSKSGVGQLRSFVILPESEQEENNQLNQYFEKNAIDRIWLKKSSQPFSPNLYKEQLGDVILYLASIHLNKSNPETLCKKMIFQFCNSFGLEENKLKELPLPIFEDTNIDFRGSLYQKSSTEHWLIEPLHMGHMSFEDEHASLTQVGHIARWVRQIEEICQKHKEEINYRLILLPFVSSSNQNPCFNFDHYTYLQEKEYSEDTAYNVDPVLLKYSHTLRKKLQNFIQNGFLSVQNIRKIFDKDWILTEGL